MSILFPNNEYSQIDLNREYGYSTRKFYSKPRVVQADNYDSALFLCWRNSNKKRCSSLPQRLYSYRNHFTLYHNANLSRICLIRAETTALVQDNDAILLYDWLTFSSSMGAKVMPRWLVAYEKSIGYSSVQSSSDNNEETNLFNSNWHLVAWGEWWYFDKGIILCGSSIFDHDFADNSQNFLDEEIQAMIMFVELYPKFQTITRNSSSSSSSKSTLQHQLDPRIMLPAINRMDNIIKNNDTTSGPALVSKYQSVMPSLYWFQKLDTELLEGNISYFIDDWKEIKSYKPLI